MEIDCWVSVALLINRQAECVLDCGTPGAQNSNACMLCWKGLEESTFWIMRASFILSQDGKHDCMWPVCDLWGLQSTLLSDLIWKHSTRRPEFMACRTYYFWNCELELGLKKLVYLKFYQKALEGLTYSDVLALLMAGGQAKCVIDSKLGRIVLVHVRLMFLKATSKGLERIDSGWCLPTCSGKLCQKTCDQRGPPGAHYLMKAGRWELIEKPLERRIDNWL